MMLEANAELAEHPQEVKPLLNEFIDVILKDMLPGLPPLRSIQHCIDFVMGSVIPNKATYLMRPEEHEELQRQVEELISRDSKSPCDVLALLVPKNNGSWQMCVDSRAINKIIVHYWFSILRLDDNLDQLCGAIIFSHIDL